MKNTKEIKDDQFTDCDVYGTKMPVPCQKTSSCHLYLVGMSVRSAKTQIVE